MGAHGADAEIFLDFYPSPKSRMTLNVLLLICRVGLGKQHDVTA